MGGKFKLGKKIGSGSFGELYLGKLRNHDVYFSLFLVLSSGLLCSHE